MKRLFLLLTGALLLAGTLSNPIHVQRRWRTETAMSFWPKCANHNPIQPKLRKLQGLTKARCFELEGVGASSQE